MRSVWSRWHNLLSFPSMFMCSDFSKKAESNIALTSPLSSSSRSLVSFSKRCLNEYLMCSRAVQWIRKCSISSGALWQSGHRSDLFFPSVWDVVSGYLWTSNFAFVDAMRDWSGSLPHFQTGWTVPTLHAFLFR